MDCDGHRGGVLPGSPEAPAIAAALDGAELRGVLAHAGESYFCYTRDALVRAAEGERAAAVQVAEELRAAGYACPVVSIGSTPTAHAVEDLTGVTEVRAGNFVFFDLVMAGIGMCTVDDLALSVVVTVIGHRPEKGWIADQPVHGEVRRGGGRGRGEDRQLVAGQHRARAAAAQLAGAAVRPGHRPDRGGDRGGPGQRVPHRRGRPHWATCWRAVRRARKSAEDVTVFDSSGIAPQDLYPGMATLRARRQGL